VNGPGLDPVALQVMTGALRAACDEMGAVLIRSAHSPNITERHDCSTALFDPAGELVMQAEHIPVHLGSMPDAVAVIVGEEHHEGDLWILNDPYRGGTHLPDITLISSVFHDGELIGFAASRAHHADIGGPTPGGMPALSVTLDEEGVVIPPTPADDAVLADLAGRMRNPEQRLADLRAQRAANLTGIRRLRQLAERHGRELLRTATGEILDYAERRTRAALEEMPDGESAAEDVLEGRDGDIPLRVSATVRGDTLDLDFKGSADQVSGNLNCPLSVTKAACFYAVRVVCDPDAPPSAGAWRPVSVSAPKGSLLNAHPPAAVVGGNVETSSRVADLVFAALAAFAPVGAEGQGTMNNLTLSGEHWTYYETIGGGQGACRDADGPSAEHVAMSNTLNTPIEALETDFPVVVRELSVRRGSGGGGRHRGGDGIVRELEAREPMRFTLIAERRRHTPHGRDEGAPGGPGRDLLGGRPIPPKSEGELKPGDRLRIETPGGGGYGAEPNH
jgi:N-methylhydantoinase B